MGLEVVRAICLWSVLMLVGCTSARPPRELPPASEALAVRGFTTARVLTHVHTPYSWDACDSRGLVNGVPDAVCLSHLRDALCQNRVDLAFLTDHPDAMAAHPFESLLLHRDGDQLVIRGAGPVGNILGGCQNGHSPMVNVGFEDRLMALGLAHHLGEDGSDRSAEYKAETRESIQKIRAAGGIAAIPHTESRSLELLVELKPDAMEVFNLHALLDFKIRGRDLGVAPYKAIPTLVGYFLDPFAELEPDLMFLFVLETFPNYFEKWNRLWSQGIRVTGLASTDAHENVLAQKLWDGERVDSFRRTTRLASNFVLTEDLSAPSIQAALLAGRTAMVFEGIGTPQGFDFTALQGERVAEMGEELSLSDGQIALDAQLPVLHREWVTDRTPRVEQRLIFVDAQGEEQVLERARGVIRKLVTEPGSYRVEVMLMPHHLKRYLGEFAPETDREFPWVISNMIRVTR